MCLNHGARMLAAAATIGALAAPAANARPIRDGGGPGHLPAAEHHSIQAARRSSVAGSASIAIAGSSLIVASAKLEGSRRPERIPLP